MHSISKPPSLSEQLADLLAEDFSIVEYIELVVDGYQFWHSQVHYYDIWLRRDYWPDVGWGQQLIGLDVRESFLLQRAIAAENMVERRASWVATLEENRVIRDKIYQMRQRIAAEQPLAVETVAGEEDMEKEGEVSVDGHGDEGESDGEPASEGGGVKIKEGVVVTDDAVVED